MPLKRHIYDVYLNQPEGVEPIEHRVVIEHQDMLRGEVEARNYGVPTAADAPMTVTTFWLWQAMRRLGTYTDEWQQFKLQDLAGFTPVTAADGTTGVDVPPTPPVVASPSPSPSPTGSATSSGGWDQLQPTSITND